MTDTRLQELKRAWEASGSIEDEAAYIRERVRVGDLTQERLELAAYCGHLASLRTVGLISIPRRPLKWAKGLKRYKGCSLRAVIYLATSLPRSTVQGVVYSPNSDFFEWLHKAIPVCWDYFSTGKRRLELGALLESYIAQFYHPTTDEHPAGPTWEGLRGDVQHKWRPHSNAGLKAQHLVALSLWGLATERDEAERRLPTLLKVSQELASGVLDQLKGELAAFALSDISEMPFILGSHHQDDASSHHSVP